MNHEGMGLYILNTKTHEVEPCKDFEIWGAFMECITRTVAKDKVGDVSISTVFLGMDHGFGERGAPVLFETMIFGGEHSDYCERYCTWEEAEAGHQRAVNLVKGQ